MSDSSDKRKSLWEKFWDKAQKDPWLAVMLIAVGLIIIGVIAWVAYDFWKNRAPRYGAAMKHWSPAMEAGAAK